MIVKVKNVQYSSAGHFKVLVKVCILSKKKEHSVKEIRDDASEKNAGSLETWSSARRNLGAALGLLFLFTPPAIARDLGQWNNQPIAVRQWFQGLMQPDDPYVSCCGEADAFEADTFEVAGDQYVAVITNGKGVIQDGTRIPIPNHKLKWDSGNPTGHGIIFIGSGGQVYCYVTPGGV
jgi:hypothetical protein